jgi:flagellar hook-associated protein 2
MTVNRIFGLSGSGIDVDSMVKQLMQARRAQYSKVYQDRTYLQWQKQAYNTVDDSITSFRTTLSNYKLSSALSIKAVTSSNTSVATATANADATNIDHNLTVTNLAEGVKLTSSGSITPAGNYKGSLFAQFGTPIGSTIDFTINGKDITVNVTDTATINDVVSAINKSGAGVKASYDSTLDRFFLYTEKTGSTAAVNFDGSSDAGMDFLFNTLKLGNFSTGLSSVGEISRNTVASADYATKTLEQLYGITGNFSLTATIDGAASTINISKSDTMSDVVTKINTAMGAGTASYDSATGRVTIKAADINHSYSLGGADATGTAFLSSNLGMVQLVQNGEDAAFNLDGVDLTQSSNTFSVSGVTYNLKGEGTSTVTVNTDVDKIVTSIQSFVDSYNKLLDELNDKIGEKRDYDYAPLTNEQKSSMEDTDITNWETKAKSGLLHSDSILTKLVYSMRNAMADQVSGLTGKYNSAASIGITPGEGSDSWVEGGHLYLDSETLKKALQENPDAVLKVFGTSGNDSAKANGIVSRLTDAVDGVHKQITDKAGVSAKILVDQSQLGKQLKNYNSSISNIEDRLEDIETRYYSQFSAMETYLQRMNQQSAWLAQQFSS